MEENPFPDLKIKSSAILDEMKGRSKCSKCNRSRKYYCYTCFIPIPELTDKVPKLKLPLKIDIIKHPSEVDGKSTAIHAGVIAPDDVTIYTYPVIPDYKNKEKVAIVFPGEESLTLIQLVEKYNNVKKQKQSQIVNPNKRKQSDSESETNRTSQKLLKTEEISDLGSELGEGNCETTDTEEDVVDTVNEKTDLENDRAGESDRPGDNLHLKKDWFLERVIFIDSTWNQTKSISGDERLRDIQRIQLSDRKTKFWRHNRDNPDTFLSTIEAIYYFICDYHKHFVSESYDGEYDNLLFFFAFMYGKIRNIYNGGDHLLAYKNRKDSSTCKSDVCDS